MGNTSFKNESRKSVKDLQENSDCCLSQEEVIRLPTTKRTAVKAPEKTTATTEKHKEESAAQQKQSSTWSLGSLSGRLNWSFTGSSKASFHNRHKSTSKSLTSLQQRRSKTIWHKPLTNAIFSSHFKESSRNEQFHIEHLIAKGAFGVVFKVIDKRLNNLHQHTISDECKRSPISTQSPTLVYALKVLKKSKIIEENSVLQIKDEADIQKLCGHHPFIVQQVDLWQNRHNLHILSEYVPNGELFSKIFQFSINLVRLYLAEIALAIDFLHNAGVIYRDAKPENILLTGSYHIKLTDFGLSKWLKLGATTKTMCGTLQYMAPEIYRGEPYGHSVDWWSLGVIVCQMLTQKSPNTGYFLDIVASSDAPDFANQPQYCKDQVDHIAYNISDISNDNKSSNNDVKAQNFLPDEVQSLPNEAKDVLNRLLQIDSKQRLRSVMALQRIALYQNFKIDAKHLQKICPLDIIKQDNIIVHNDNNFAENYIESVENPFKGF